MTKIVGGIIHFFPFAFFTIVFLRSHLKPEYGIFGVGVLGVELSAGWMYINEAALEQSSRRRLNLIDDIKKIA